MDGRGESHIVSSMTVAHILQQLVQRFETAFPDRVRGYYLYGSRLDGTAVSTSDIDITVLFKDGFIEDAERTAANDLATSQVYPIKTDIETVDERDLFASADPAFKLASVCFAGTDVRDQIRLMPIEVWTRDRMHTSYWRFIKLFNRAIPVRLPLDYPDPDDEFFGYIRVENPDDIPNTRNLVRAVTWAATGLVALHARQYVVRKADCYAMYQHYISDMWGTFIEEIYTRCKLAWNYAIPADRTALRDICSRLLAFENHFMGIYREFLIAELTSEDKTALPQALQILSYVPFSDSQVRDAQQWIETLRDKE
jgi:hypothetical protein